MTQYFKLKISRLQSFTISYDKTSYRILKRGPGTRLPHMEVIKSTKMVGEICQQYYFDCFYFSLVEYLFLSIICWLSSTTRVYCNACWNIFVYIYGQTRRKSSYLTYGSEITSYDSFALGGLHSWYLYIIMGCYYFGWESPNYIQVVVWNICTYTYILCIIYIYSLMLRCVITIHDFAEINI